MAARRVLAVLVASICLLCAGVSTARAGSLELNGVIVDAIDPGKSAAIVDGRRLHVGSRWQGFELTEIGEGFVRLRESASGDEKVLTMGASTVASAPKSLGLVPRTRAVAVNLAAIPEPAFLERINPLRLVWMAYTAMAQASLRQIYTAQQLFSINDLDYNGSDQYSDSLAELAHHRLVQADLAAGGKFGYRFAVRSWEDKSGPHFECIAEPVRNDTRQPYMYVDETGVIRGQLFARAGYDSPTLN